MDSVQQLKLAQFNTNSKNDIGKRSKSNVSVCTEQNKGNTILADI